MSQEHEAGGDGAAPTDAVGDLYFRQHAVGDMANLVYIVGSRSTREAVLIDPAWAVDGLMDQAAEDGMTVVGSLVTHYHQDHIGGEIFGHSIEGLAKLMERQEMPVHVQREEAQGTAQIAGIPESLVEAHDPGDVIELGGVRIKLLHTPGHTPGSQCFLVEDLEQPGTSGALVSGDTLFLGSCGRVDLPGSDPEDMYRSLNEILGRLPDETLLFPGHLYSQDSHSTMGDEKRTNPFLRVSSLDQFLQFMGR